MVEERTDFPHLGGGRKGIFLMLRYLFIAGASYMLVFQPAPVQLLSTQALMIAAALTSNVVLSLLPAELVFSWYVEAPILVADTLWVSWALHSTGSVSEEFFLLYFFVLSLAALGESLLMVLLGSTVISVANLYLSAGANAWTSPHLLRVVFFYIVALFYGNVISQIKRERQRADRGFAWARELEQKVAERTHELSRLYEESQAANRLKSEFVANVSHELRTPLQIIMGYAEILLNCDMQQTPAEERQRMIRRIGEAASQQEDLIESVLSLGKLEAGQMPVQLQPVALDTFAQALRDRQRMKPAPGVILQWQFDANLPVIQTDPVKLAIVVDNLINNAIKFTLAGSISVCARAVRTSPQVELRVTDTGPGIAAQDLPVIFDAFRQVDGSTARSHGGVGLGLAIVRKYLDLLHGSISVNSQVGAGTTFVVTLPHHPPGEAALAAEPPGSRWLWHRAAARDGRGGARGAAGS